MDNAFRMAIPIQVVNLADKFDDLKGSVTAVSLDARFRYFTGLTSCLKSGCLLNMETMESN